MRIRNHFRTSSATIDYIIADFSFNRIINRENYFMLCVRDRLDKLGKEYNEKVDKLLNFIILYCDYSNLPIDIISRMIFSLSKVTNALAKGIVSLL